MKSNPAPLAVSFAATASHDFRGTAYNGGSVTIELPAGNTLDGYNAISLWCLPAQANFGSGTFAVPEPVSAGLLPLCAITLVGLSLRRPRRAAE